MKFVAPELPEMGPRYPDWILLATRAYISDRKNATVAHSHTSDGHPIQVSLFAATPPAVSHLCVHSPGREEQFSYNPAVISREDLILFDVCFGNGDVSDYFIYKAGSETPSLVRIPDPEPYISGFRNTGIVCCGADHFAVAALVRENMDMFKLAVFDSKTGVWETRLLPLEPLEPLGSRCSHLDSARLLPLELLEPLGSRCSPLEVPFFSSKVIPLKGSLLGWVDLWWGILVCDVLSDNPKLHYIPMPKPMPSNEGFQDEGEPSYFRDVTGCEDMITFVEMEYDYHYIPVTDPSCYSPDGWTAVIGSRRLDSREWIRNHVVNIENITVSEDCHGRTDLLPQFCENGTPSLKKMPIGTPTLGDCNNVLYLMSKVKFGDTKGWVVAVDINSKRLEAVSTFSAASLPGFSTAYYPSSFSKYFNKNSTGIYCFQLEW
uniref:DUF1618 domain-containing protein n=2 Tax=Setaria italica TaxID=4555 RepID=K3Y145_SETIT